MKIERTERGLFRDGRLISFGGVKVNNKVNSMSCMGMTTKEYSTKELSSFFEMERVFDYLMDDDKGSCISFSGTFEFTEGLDAGHIVPFKIMRWTWQTAKEDWNKGEKYKWKIYGKRESVLYYLTRALEIVEEREPSWLENFDTFTKTILGQS